MSSSLFLFLLLLQLLQQTCQAAAAAAVLAATDSQAVAEHYCQPSSCGEIANIKPPFRLTTDPQGCGDHNYALSCESNATVMYLESGRYYVKAINYNNFTIRLVDDGVVKGNCSSFPAHPLSNNRLDSSSFDSVHYSKSRGGYFMGLPMGYGQYINGVLALVSCDNPVDNSTLYVETAPCIGGFGPHSPSSYAIVGNSDDAVLSELAETCSLEMFSLFPIITTREDKVTFPEIHRRLEYGFQLAWPLDCSTFCPSYPACYPDDDGNVRCMGIWIRLVRFAWFTTGVLISTVVAYRLLLVVLGTPVVVAFLVYKWRRRHRSAYHSIEEFLQNQTHLMPIRYSYSHIKKITGGFKDKLGQGGFGSVYKAKLRSGSFAAVKLLDTKNNKPCTGRKGQDFMNEVATIGRIHHANVVRLIGYCSEGSKQALVYEFMPNGSLDKHISHHEDGGGGDQGSTTSFLSLEQLYRISLGVARGIEYLHSGCDMQILHFDIKPHNILLDEDFAPKVSDFGLARLNQAGRDNNIATLTAARGTIGYMAPELFYKNIGGVSYKADVYSFGMLLLEMVGKRRNSNTAATDQSTAYFPSWVHDQVSTPGTAIAVGEVTEEEDNIAKKMVMVGLWCIQMKPDGRPPMNRVVEMLEGNLDSLQLPPKPVLYPGEVARTNEEGSSSSSFASSFEYTQSVISTQCD